MTDLNQGDWAEADASNTAASPNGWPGGMLPSAVEPSARAMRGALKRFYNQVAPTVISGGSANTQTLTYVVARTAYVAGDPYAFKAGFSNTGATTLNVNALGAKTVQLAGAALVANDIRAGFYYGVVYDGTNFQLVFSSALFSVPASRLPTRATAVVAPADPFGNSTTSLLMAGLGGVCKITPATSGTIVFHFDFTAANSGAGGSDFKLYIGTGTAPANGVAAPGGGASLGIDAAVAAPGSGFPVSLQNLTTGQVIGTPIWCDIAQASIVGGTTSISRINFSAFELN